MRKVSLVMLALVFLSAFSMTGCKHEAKGEESNTDSKELTATTENSEEEAPVQASPRKQSTGEVDGVTVSIDYGSPSVKGRTIWGGLESYGKVWRAGANETTSVEFSADVTVNGESLPAGKYGFFLIPMEKGSWMAVFNEEWSRELHGAWGAFSYKQEKDVLRIDVNPVWADDVMESLQYKVVKSGFEFGWEKARLNFEVKAK